MSRGRDARGRQDGQDGQDACFQLQQDNQQHEWPRRHEGTKKNFLERLLFFVSSWPDTRLVTQILLQAVTVNRIQQDESGWSRKARDSGTLRRQFKAPWSVSSEHSTASVQSTLQRQFKAPYSVSAEYSTASVPSTLQRQRRVL